MKLKSLKNISLALVMLMPTYASAQLFQAEPADKLFDFGVRVGINTANLPGDIQRGTSDVRQFESSAWGMGFSAGAVVDLNMMDYISLQPGLFFETHSNKYSALDIQPVGEHTVQPIFGSAHHCQLTIPVLASLHLHPAKGVLWNIDLGPYLGFGFGGADKGYTVVLTADKALDVVHYDVGYYRYHRRVDFGLKMGTGFRLSDHYYAGVHYTAGCLNMWKEGRGTRSRAWTFTLGYDF